MLFGQTLTPLAAVNLLLDSLPLSGLETMFDTSPCGTFLVAKSFLDMGCGCGQFIVTIAERLVGALIETPKWKRAALELSNKPSDKTSAKKDDAEVNAAANLNDLLQALTSELIGVREGLVAVDLENFSVLLTTERLEMALRPLTLIVSSLAALCSLCCGDSKADPPTTFPPLKVVQLNLLTDEGHAWLLQKATARATGGFDYIVSCPPYRGREKEGADVVFSFLSSDRWSDDQFLFHNLFGYFIKDGVGLLNNLRSSRAAFLVLRNVDGTVPFHSNGITPYPKTDSNLRAYLLERTHIRNLWYLGDGVFSCCANARTVDTVILTLSHKEPLQETREVDLRVYQASSSSTLGPARSQSDLILSLSKQAQVDQGSFSAEAWTWMDGRRP